MAPQTRIQALAQALQEAGQDVFLAWSKYTMRYLVGFGEDPHERFLALAVHADGRTRLICPALSAAQAARAGIDDIRSWKDGEDPLIHFGELAQDWGLRSAILAVDANLPAHMLLAMQDALPNALYKSGEPLVAKLRRIKSAEELDRLRAAARIADRAYQAGLQAIRPGATERTVADALKQSMQEQGGIPTFTIVAVGPNAAEPHHLTDDTPIQNGDIILMDFGCEFQDYQSDITRVVALGSASEEQKKVYKIIYQAYQAGRAAIQPGTPAGTIDETARQVIEEAGYGPAFIHRLGHGIGMEGHEEPNLNPGNPHKLEVGNCFSVEPGIYLPGKFGVRLETIVAVTKDGHENLNEAPAPELQIL